MFQVSAHAWRTRRRRLTGHEDIADDPPTVVAAYDRDPSVAAQRCFDRDTGKPVEPDLLETYARALAQYHLHPEAKFEHADWLDRGETKRWHVIPTVIEHIGKEANLWEEQLYLGELPEAQINYGFDPADLAMLEEALRDDLRVRGNQTRLAKTGVASRSSLYSFAKGGTLGAKVLVRLYKAMQALEADDRERRGGNPTNNIEIP
jgi:hypothetical protein